MLTATKYFCRDKYFSQLKTKQNKNKTVFVATSLLLSGQKYACRDKTFVATNTCLSRQTFFCRDKRFVAASIH